MRIRELVRNALRMRPDRIIVGEVRGAETLDMLQAMNTGHEGSLTTIHANSPRDALSRLETLVLTAGVDLPLRAIREQISSAFDLLVQISRLVDGTRRITHVTEVLRMESDVITLQDIFAAKAPDEGSSSAGGGNRLLTPLLCTGLKPQFLDKLAANGVGLHSTFFVPEDEAGAAACATRTSRRGSEPSNERARAAPRRRRCGAGRSGAGGRGRRAQRCRHELVPDDPRHRRLVGGCVRDAGGDGERPSRRRAQRGEPRPREGGRARGRRLAVDGGQAARRRGRRRAELRRGEAAPPTRSRWSSSGAVPSS